MPRGLRWLIILDHKSHCVNYLNKGEVVLWPRNKAVARPQAIAVSKELDVMVQWSVELSLDEAHHSE